MSAKLVNLDAYLGGAVPANYHGNRARMVSILEQIQRILGAPLTITSGYRDPARNAAVGGSKTSAHLTASAADFRVPGMTTPTIARKLLEARARGDMPAIGEIIFYPFKPGQDVHVTIPGAGGNNEWLFQTHEGGYTLATAERVAAWLKSGAATVGGLGLLLLAVLVLVGYLSKGG